MDVLLSVPQWSLLNWSALIIGGIACGFVNTLAGGGSFITLPLLLYLGQPPQIANATNRMALVFQTGTAVYGYWNAGERDTQTVLWLAGPGLLGSVLGAYIAVYLNPAVFRPLFGVMLLLAVLPVLFRPKIFDNQAQDKDATEQTKPKPLLLVGFFFVGVYSGFLQSGVGVWSLLLLLLLSDFQVNHANAVKSQLLLLTTISASLLFLWFNQVVLLVALVLAVGNAGGSWLATRLVKDRKVPWLRWLILGGALAASLKLFQIV